ncbi:MULTISPECIES: COX15/CtaA family protein [unclassified Halomonas]|uniref:COX15/CtaA family protein n=1 Tax=unclassified Halomonas TaxID=2609666 RepID=UPI002076686D|nr:MULTISPECIES: COX15/CtaA family protein [unclassified Halomonas]
MQYAMEKRLKWLGYLTLAGVLLTACVILLGAWTRLVDAGLGCPDWPGCYGRLLVPDSEHAVLKHPDSPLEPAKAWMEMIHRYMATLLGAMVVTIVLLGHALRHLEDYPWHLSIVLLGVVALQGAFGALTVTLKLWPQVVTLHLLGGISVLMLFLWLYLRVRRSQQQTPLGRRAGNPLWALAALLLVLQLALGGWVTSNYAGLACQGVPACNAQWWPPMDFSEALHLTQTVGPNYLHGQLHADARTAIQFIHRFGALLLGLALMTLLCRYRHAVSLRGMLSLTLGAYLAQAALGAANVLMWLPLWLALLHTAGAVLLSASFCLAWWHWRQLEEVDVDKTVALN